jgi:hypothetical protein
MFGPVINSPLGNTTQAEKYTHSINTQLPTYQQVLHRQYHPDATTQVANPPGFGQSHQRVIDNHRGCINTTAD